MKISKPQRQIFENVGAPIVCHFILKSINIKTDGVFKKVVRCPNQKSLWISTKNNGLSHSFLEVSRYTFKVLGLPPTNPIRDGRRGANLPDCVKNDFKLPIQDVQKCGRQTMSRPKVMVLIGSG